MPRGSKRNVRWALQRNIWVPVAASAVADEPAVDESAVADDDPDVVGSDSGSIATTFEGSTVLGDSLHSGDDDAAVAAGGASEPRHNRDTRPPEAKLAPNPPAWSTLRNDAKHVGNVGWLFGNWGKRPHDQQLREHLDMELKKNRHDHRAC